MNIFYQHIRRVMFLWRCGCVALRIGGTHAFRTSAQTFSFDRDPFALPGGKSKVLETPKFTKMARPSVGFILPEEQIEIASHMSTRGGWGGGAKGKICIGSPAPL